MFGFFVTGCTRLGGDTTGDATGGYEGCGGFLERKPIPTVGEEIPPKNFAQGFVGEDIILPKTIPLRKKNGRTGDTGNFLKRKFPEPFKELAERLWE